MNAMHKIIQRHEVNIIEMKLSKSWRDWSDGQSIDSYARDVPARRWV